MTNAIEKTIEVKAPIERVWRALTDAQEFATWFGAVITTPFASGQKSGAQVEHCGVTRLLNMTIQKIEPQHHFSFTWNPYNIDPNEDYDAETPTLVEFTLEKIPGGTRLKVIESGFDQLPAHRRDVAFRAHDGGWVVQLGKVAKYVEQNP